MPYTWLSFSTATSPNIVGKSPTEIQDFINKDLTEGKALYVFFDVGKPTGYVLFKDLGDSRETKRVSNELGGTGATKMLDAEQAQDVPGTIPGGAASA